MLNGLFTRSRVLYSLVSHCGLNNVKHEEVINGVVGKGLMSKIERPWGNKILIKKHKLSEKGREILNMKLEPYEALFPRSEADKPSSSSSWVDNDEYYDCR